MKNLNIIALLLLLVGCSSNTHRHKISADTLEQRYLSLWESVDEFKKVPPLIAHIGASTANKTAIWVLLNETQLLSENRDWQLQCGPHGNVPLYESIYDPKFSTAQLIVKRDKHSNQLRCTLKVGNLVTEHKLLLPKVGDTNHQDPSTYSFLAYSCNEPFTTKERNGHQGILKRDISLWLRMQARALGEDSQQQLPFQPEFVLGLGDQIYVDPDPESDEPIAFFGGDRSDKWLIEADTETLYAAFRTVYKYNFSYPPLDGALSKLSSKMMWDDHEIRDGWGSQGDEHKGKWPEYFKIARHAFIANQLLRNILPDTITQAQYDKLISDESVLHQQFQHRQKTHFLMLDSRSTRNTHNAPPLFESSTQNQVNRWLQQGSKNQGDLYVLTVGTPLFPSKGEKTGFFAKNFVLPFKKGLIDDVRDAWASRQNEPSRQQLIAQLRQHFADNPQDRLLVLSGDVHYSSLFALAINGRIFGHEVVTSGIAHSLPSGGATAQYLFNIAKEVGNVTVKPLGKITDSTTFAEIIVIENDDAKSPDLKLVFHANGTKVNIPGNYHNHPSHVLANTDLIIDRHSIPAIHKRWYHKYNLNFTHGEHLKEAAFLKSNVKPAGTIISLDLGQLSKLDLKISKIKRDIISGIQQQSIFCTVADSDYETSLATDWFLSKEKYSCIRLK